MRSSAGAVDRAVGPAAEHGADEAFCLAVGAGPVGPGAGVFDPERGAGELVQRSRCRRGRCRSSLSAPGCRRRRSARQRGAGSRQRWRLSRRRAPRRRRAGWRRRRRRARTPSRSLAAAAPVAGDAMAGPLDPDELLHVDMDRARPAAASRSGSRARAGSSRESFPSPIRVSTAETVESGIREHLRDLRGRHPQPAQRRDRLDPLLPGAMGDRQRLRRAIQQAPRRLLPGSGQPTSRQYARWRRQPRPPAASVQPCSKHPHRDQPTAMRTGPRVSVQPHPDPSLDGWRLRQPPASKETRMNNVPRNYI